MTNNYFHELPRKIRNSQPGSNEYPLWQSIQECNSFYETNKNIFIENMIKNGYDKFKTLIHRYNQYQEIIGVNEKLGCIVNNYNNRRNDNSILDIPWKTFFAIKKYFDNRLDEKRKVHKMIFLSNDKTIRFTVNDLTNFNEEGEEEEQTTLSSSPSSMALVNSSSSSPSPSSSSSSSSPSSSSSSVSDSSSSSSPSSVSGSSSSVSDSYPPNGFVGFVILISFLTFIVSIIIFPPKGIY